MKRRGRFVAYSVVVFCLSLYSHAQQWSGILNALTADQKNVSRSAVDWSNAGVPGGIPSGNWTQCGSTIQSATYENGSIDATAAINAAIAGCPANTYVLLGPGKFLFNSSGAGSPQIKLSKNGVVLRGSGADQTILNSTGTNSDGYITVGQGSDPGRGYGTNNPVTNSVNITSGATAGSTSIVVSDGTNFAAGGAAVIQELNDATYVTKTGPSDQCDYCDGFWNGDRSRGQTVEVMSCSPSCGNHGATTITISPPLYTAYTLTPQALPFTPTRYTGIEDLQIYSNNTHTSQRNAPIALYSCLYCWVKGVEENYTDGDYSKVYWALHFEIRDSYFSNGFSHGPGTNNNAVWAGFKSSAGKIENNIIERCENPVMLQFGASGNVIAYNYATGCYGVPTTITVSVEWHSAHLQFNLVEGNVAPALWLDVGHGSTSQTTSFRNWWLGTGKVCNTSIDSRGTVDCSGGNGIWTTDGSRAIGDDSLSVTSNFIGDVVGSDAQQALSGTKVSVVKWSTSRKYNGTSYGLSFGYSLFGDSGTNSFDSTTPFSTSFIHGLYNNVDSSTTWASGVTHTLPASFYLSSKPTWWSSNIPWPPIGVDVTGGIGPGGHANMTPAEACYYNVMKGTDGGPGSPFTFNADSCYGSQSGGVKPPTNLDAVVH